MTCPICDKPTEKAFRPFCSKRCADRDLVKWLNGAYAIPSDDPDEVQELYDALQDTTEVKPH